MTDRPEGNDAQEGRPEVRGKLLARLATAVILVAGLIGVLVFFDHLANSPDESEEQVFSKPVPVPPRKEISQPVKPAENLPEPPVEKADSGTVEAPPAPPVAAQPVEESKPRTEPEPAVASTRTIANRQPTAKPPAEPKHVSVPEATSSPNNLIPPPESKQAARTSPPESAPANRLPQRPVEVIPSPPAPPSAPRLFSGFILQAGVFSSVQRAEELHARLTLSGVPSTLETRVQVGPFRTRQEAEMAQAKLRELGIQAILVPPKGKN